MNKRVVVAMSGGVDSSVAAYLVKKQGYDVVGIFMKNWHDSAVTISGECPWEKDSRDAMAVAQKLNIPFKVVDFSEEYRERIVEYMFSEYEKGKTPNPDILCNKEIKFDVFLKFAMELNADFLATGHYARKDMIVKDGKEIYRLLSGKDKSKDQSYFLCQLSQKQLAKTLFPIGDLEKKEVRKIASELELITANKKDSQGLCFVGKVKLPEFLKQKLKPLRGDVVEISDTSAVYGQTNKNTLEELSKKSSYSRDDGEIIGQHNGAFYFTVGQRKGLGIGGKKEPLFVIDIDTRENVVYVGEGSNHRGLFRRGLFVENENINWIREDFEINSGDSLDVFSRVRYRQPLKKSKLYRRDDGYYIIFEQEVFAITSGQFVAWYVDDELIGSGIIG